MTIEKHCYVKPGDIEAVQFKCATCGGSTSVPVGRLHDGDLHAFLVSICRHCRTGSGFVINGTDLENLLRFTTLLAGINQTLKGKNLQLSFQVKCPE
jgi:hypothetical protein